MVATDVSSGACIGVARLSVWPRSSSNISLGVGTLLTGLDVVAECTALDEAMLPSDA